MATGFGLKPVCPTTSLQDVAWLDKGFYNGSRMEWQDTQDTGMNLSIKNVPEDTVQRLRERARKNHRSMQGELLAILEEVVKPRRLTVHEIAQRAKELDFRTGDDSVWMIREDRDSR